MGEFHSGQDHICGSAVHEGDECDEGVGLIANGSAYTVSCNEVNQCLIMLLFCRGCSMKPTHYFLKHSLYFNR